ncbi:MAG: hypothetical protein ACE5JD_00275 [Candidatus Methylomirabilia bacterium]
MGRMARMFKALLRHLRDSRGISLYEITAAVAMAGIIAAVAVPVALQQIQSAEGTAAKQETETIFKAAFSFFNDTGKWPGELEMDTSGNDGIPDQTIFLVSGSAPLPALTDLTLTPNTCLGNNTCAPPVDLNTYLSASTGPSGYSNWNGPYMDPITADPWGRAYIFNPRPLFDAEDLGAHNYLGYGWVISGGSDQTLTTDFVDSDLDPNGNDIGRSLGKKIVQN